MQKEGINIKKVISLLLVAVIAVTACVACTRKNNNDGSVEQSEILTEGAKIKESNAIDFIEKNYTAEELGLDKEKSDYTFMVAANGVKIDKGEYVKVVANVLTRNDVTSADGKETFSIKTVGEYYIAFNGKKVLSKNMKTGEFTELKVKSDPYEHKGDKTSTTK